MEMFRLWIHCNLYLLLPILVTGLTMSFLCMRSEAKIRKIWGWGGIVVTGMIGTPIHECSHLLMALLFGYKIADVKLFCPVSGKTTGVLGYVKYRYRKNLFCKIGNFFVGIAPMLGGSLVIGLLFWLLLPETALCLKDISIADSYGGFPEVLKHLDRMMQSISGHEGKLLLFLILLMAVSLHMSISKADLKGAAYGVLFLELILVALSVLTSVISWNGIFTFIESLIGFLWLSLSIGLVAACFTFLVVSVIPAR